MRSRTCAEHHIRPSFTSIFASLVNGRESNHSLNQWPSQALSKTKNSCVAVRRLVSWSQAEFGQVGYVWKAVFTSLSSRACERKWRKDCVTGPRQPNSCQSFRSVAISGTGMITIAAVNSAVWMMVSHFALKTDPVSFVKTGCQKPGLHKPRLRHRRIVARPRRGRKLRRKQVRPWTILWRYTHQKTLCRLLPGVPSPKNRPRPSGRKQPQVPLNPSPWLPVSGGGTAQLPRVGPPQV